MEVSYGNPWPIRQTKCLPICVCCLIAKLNVHQMYHLYSIITIKLKTYVSLLQNLLLTVATSSSLSSKMNILDAYVIKKFRVYLRNLECISNILINEIHNKSWLMPKRDGF